MTRYAGEYDRPIVLQECKTPEQRAAILKRIAELDIEIDNTLKKGKTKE